MKTTRVDSCSVKTSTTEPHHGIVSGKRPTRQDLSRAAARRMVLGLFNVKEHVYYLRLQERAASSDTNT